MCSGRSSPGVKLTDCGAPKLIQTSCIWVTVLIISQQTVQPSQFLLGSPRFSLKIFNTDQNERGIGKIRIFTSFCDDACLHRILIILMPEHHIECSQLKPIFQKLKKLQEIYRKIKYLIVRQAATRSGKATKGYLCLYICQPSSLIWSFLNAWSFRSRT